MQNNTISLDQLAFVIGGQSAAPGMAGGRWSTAPNPNTGSTPFTAPGMGIRDVMQGSGVPQGGINTNPGGGGGGGGGRGGERLAPLT